MTKSEQQAKIEEGVVYSIRQKMVRTREKRRNSDTVHCRWVQRECAPFKARVAGFRWKTDGEVRQTKRTYLDELRKQYYAESARLVAMVELLSGSGEVLLGDRIPVPLHAVGVGDGM